jgi:ribonuclease BN (tRNA processing enzyme)
MLSGLLSVLCANTPCFIPPGNRFFKAKEDLDMELIILGSGTGIPLRDRASPALALITDSHPVLFDMGPGTLRQLSRIGIDCNRIAHIFITHFHPDHSADLIHFLFATRNPPSLKQREPFVITGPLGFTDFLGRLGKAYGKWLEISPEIMTLEELDTDKREERKYKDFELISQPVAHTPESLAYRIEFSSGKNFVYTGDTAFCDGLVDLASGTDLLVSECSFPDGQGVEGHMTPSRAGRLATLAGVKKLVLVHFYPEILATDIAAQCRGAYDGTLILGRDLLHLRI